MILRYHWGLARKDKAREEGESATRARAEKCSYSYRGKDFNFALSLEISEDKGCTTNTREKPKGSTKRLSGRGLKRKA